MRPFVPGKERPWIRRAFASLVGAFLLAAVSACSLARADQNGGATFAPAIRVTMLGTGTPVPNATQYGSSTLIEAGGQAFLFDCGRGCGIRLAQARRELFNKIDAVFLTHLHSDHVVGLPDLWLNGWTQGRAVPLKVIGPIGTSDMMAGFRQAFAFDTHMRGEVEKVPATMTALETDIAEISGDGVVFQQGGVTVTAFLVDHAAIKPAFGYRIDYGGRSVLLSGDTRPTPNLLKYGKGVDLLVLDVMSPMMIENVRARRTSREAQIIIGHHMSVGEAAELLGQAKPGLAVYSHTINRPEAVAQLLAATREVYDGPLTVAEDILEINIGTEIIVKRPDGNAPKK